jgi:hypothetical protein
MTAQALSLSKVSAIQVNFAKSISMADKLIPYAYDSKTPSQKIKAMRQATRASEGDECIHSSTLTALSSSRLASVPVAQKHDEKHFVYFDANGKTLAKEDAIKRAGGVIYYPDQSDSSKGRLRCQGKFISVQDAHAIVSTSNHRVAVTTLASLQLENVPVAQKIDENRFSYLEANGKTLTKEEALKSAEGVVYYQDQFDPSKGRLRCRGTFISVDNARHRVSAFETSNCSSVSNLQNNSGLPADGQENVPQDTRSRRPVKFESQGPLRWLAMLALFAIAASLASAPTAGTADMKLLEHLDPKLAQLLEKHARSHCVKAQAGCDRDTRTSFSGSAHDSTSLSLPLSKLLLKDEMHTDDEDDTVQRFLDGPVRATKESKDHLTQKAAKEVERILACRDVEQILGGGTPTEQRRAFNRIVRLLHPDKGLTSENDTRASLALRLAFAARKASFTNFK